MADLSYVDGQKSYWVRASPDRAGLGVVVATAWMFSKRRHLEPYTRLYAAARFDSLVCHPPVLNLWFPSRAEVLAVHILDELLKEVENKPRPVVFVTFSGGAKACLYKIFQILQADSNGGAGSLYAGKYGAVTACVRGQIHDSSPVDMVSALGARFATFSVSQSLGQSVYGLSALSLAVANILDALFLPKFELQREDYWSTLKESSKLGPFLILCSANDDLAPYDTISKFATVIRESGCPVRLVVWDASDHVGHLRNFPKEYHAAVKAFLDERRLHAIETSPMDTLGTRNEGILPQENSEMEFESQSSPSSRTINSTNVVSSQRSCSRSTNPLLSSKL